MRNYRFECTDLSGGEPAEIVEKKTAAAIDFLEECSAKDWVVVSFVPFKSETENQYIGPLIRYSRRVNCRSGLSNLAPVLSCYSSL